MDHSAAIAFIRQERVLGHSDDQIRQAFLVTGWNREQIDAVFSLLPPMPPNPVQSVPQPPQTPVVADTTPGFLKAVHVAADVLVVTIPIAATVGALIWYLNLQNVLNPQTAKDPSEQTKELKGEK